MATDRQHGRVFLLGLDGATFTLLRPWIDEGHLPTLARLLAEGAWGPLTSVIPPMTPVAWTSMVTGVRPGKHGIFGFLKTRPGRYEREPSSSLDRRRPAIWNLLDRAGRPSILVGVPYTYPPEPINGVVVSGFGTPSVDGEFVHPRSLREVILREFGPYPLEVRYRKDVLGRLEDAHRLTAHRHALVRFLMREFPWDFFMFVLMTTDRLQHLIWRHVDPSHPWYDSDEARRYAPGILDYYRRLDDMVADLLARLDAQTTFMLVSDHGFGPLERSVSLLRWLGQAGLLRVGGRRWAYAPPRHTPAFTPRGSGRIIRSDGAASGELRFEVDGPDAFAGAVFRLTGLDPLRRYELAATVPEATTGALLEFSCLGVDGQVILGGGALHRGAGSVSTVFYPPAPKIDLMVCLTSHGGNPWGHVTISSVTLDEREDWSGTAAYVVDDGEATGGPGIRLNVRGREPAGIVTMGQEYEALRDRIIAGLEGLQDAQGRRLVDRVYRREEVYAGPYVDEAPDLLVVFADGVGGTARHPQLSNFIFDGPVSAAAAGMVSGWHRADGIFIARGPAIAPATIRGAHLLDVCPTVLHLLGALIPGDLDGRVLTEILHEDARGAPASAGPAAEAAFPEGSAAEVYTPAERRKLEDHLRNLGYIE
ncbi:MAG: alkaline phosphatase family protein [Armatimonadota bacterium]|nr:alkaline phosphatase family protein [Armatimonadota bacterium]MDR7549078.1 alkaline phosphatase family protein [Armatimonadota bacterium]